jgi:hypothetical protein
MTQQAEYTGTQARIHIDQFPYESPNPTTGSALYALGKVPVGLELFREVEGDREDAGVPNDGTAIHLRQDAHFHSGAAVQKLYHIIVNLEPKDVNKKLLTFLEVVTLAYANPPMGPNIVYTVTYRKAAGPMHQGSLVEGGTVEIKNGTIFSVTQTDKS